MTSRIPLFKSSSPLEIQSEIDRIKEIYVLAVKSLLWKYLFEFKALRIPPRVIVVVLESCLRIVNLEFKKQLNWVDLKIAVKHSNFRKRLLRFDTSKIANEFGEERLQMIFMEKEIFHEFRQIPHAQASRSSEATGILHVWVSCQMDILNLLVLKKKKKDELNQGKEDMSERLDLCRDTSNLGKVFVFNICFSKEGRAIRAPIIFLVTVH